MQKVKSKLHLRDLAAVAIKPPAPVKEEPVAVEMPAAPAEEAKVMRTRSHHRPRHQFTTPKPAHAEAREFTFVDGRPIVIVRHAVQFFCPLKDQEETATLVSIKGGIKACPLAIPYPEFKAWALRAEQGTGEAWASRKD